MNESGQYLFCRFHGAVSLFEGIFDWVVLDLSICGHGTFLSKKMTELLI